MTTQNFDVNKLRVAKPCHMSWESMSGDEKTRLCNSCEMNIYNISEMTSDEINTLIQNREGRLCGRIVRRTDGTVMTTDCPVGLKAYRKKICRFAGAAFTAIISLFSIGFGQTESKKPAKSETQIIRKDNQDKENILHGIVTDSFGAVIPNAEIVITNSRDKSIFKLKTSDIGEFKISNLSQGTYEFLVTRGDFKPYKIKRLVIKSNENVEIQIKLETTGEVVGIFIDTPSEGIESESYQISRKILRSSGITKGALQSGKSNLKGITTDSAGAIIPEAKIELKSKKGKKIKLKTESSENGNYSFDSIPNGEYTLKIEYEGFKTFQIENLIIKENEDIKLNVTLEPKETSVTVGIFVTEPLIDMIESGITHKINGETLRKLPINK